MFNPTAFRMAKTLWSFGSSECNRVNANNKLSNQSDCTLINSQTSLTVHTKSDWFENLLFADTLRPLFVCYGSHDFMTYKVINLIQTTMIVINSESTDLCQARLQICIFATILPIKANIIVVTAQLQIRQVFIDNSRVIYASSPYIPTAFIQQQDGNFIL